MTRSSDDMMMTDSKAIIEEASNEDSESEECDFDQPWTYWKWLIPVYASLLVVTATLTFSYWMTQLTS